MDRHYFNPTPDTIYTNKGGGSYICLEAEGHFRAKFQRVSKYKWTFVAHGCQMYEDGTIEWDSSTGGYFEEWLSDVRGRHNRVGQLHRRILRGMIPHKWDLKSHFTKGDNG